VSDFAAGRGQRVGTFRFELLDQTNSSIGDLTADMSSPVSISNRINRAVKRTLDGLRLPPSVTQDIDTLRHRIRAWGRLETMEEVPLGVFLFADASRTLALSAGGYYQLLGESWWTEGTCMDQLATLNQGSRGINFYPAGYRVYDALVQQMEAAGVVEYDIDATEARIAQPVVWKPNHNRLTIVNELLAMAGFYSLWYNGAGRAQLRKVPALDAATPTVLYTAGSGVYLDSIVKTDDQLKMPNSYVVINSSFTDSPIWGEWLVPASAPHSFDNRGFYVTHETDMQGVESMDAAAEAAKAVGQSDYASYRWLNFTTPPDLRFDTFDVLGWLDGDRYRSQGWDLTCLEGEDMQHEARRIWSDSVADFLAEAA
jgi:hypothetical protein